ncbi:MAG: hypothetical protein ABR572_02825 [Cryomorphaceae bacterium]|nr:hypothetical protein [Flavobacteriales bacterium]
MKHDIIVISIVSALLLIYTILASLEMYLGLVFLLVGISPLLIIWMVWTVLRHGEYNGPELDSGQEYGYLDR